MVYYCNICKKDITKAEYVYSKDKFGRALCRDHQKLERRTREKSFLSGGQESAKTEQEPSNADAKEIIASDGLINEDTQKINWKSRGKKVVGKIGKGAIKGVKKIVEASKKQIQIRKWREKILRRMNLSQLKRLCFEENISTKKTIEEDGDYFDDVIEREVACSKDDLASRLKNHATLDTIISFANRNRIDIREITEEIEKKKKEWNKDENIENTENYDLKTENNGGLTY